MTANPHVELVVAFLRRAGFRQVETPFELAGLRIDVPAVFVGVAPSPDLILIGDTAFGSAVQLLQTVRTVARALDTLGSRRPLTAIVVGPRPESGVLREMTSLCRVLPTATSASSRFETELQDRLAVLLPLTLEQSGDSVSDPLAELSLSLPTATESQIAVLGVASAGPEAVRMRLHELVAGAISAEGESQ